MSREPVDVVFAFALRAGALLVRNGAPAANVTHVLLAIARRCGYPGASANVTMGEISLSLVPRDVTGAISLVHNVGATTFDVEAITATEAVVTDVVTGDRTAADGLTRLRAIEEARPAHGGLARLGGWGVMAGGFAALIGGGPATCLVASLTSVVIELVAGRLLREELPAFFAHVIAGIAAVAAALAAHLVAPGQPPALVITAALVSRLAGAALHGAAQDLLTGWYLTAAGRLVEAGLNTAGQVVGVILAAGVGRRWGMGLTIAAAPELEPSVLVSTIAAVLVSVGFAVAGQVRWQRLPVVAAMAGAAYLVAAAARAAGADRYVAVAVAAAVLGVVTVLAATVLRLPSSSALSLGLAPLLPGMLLYEGFVAVVLRQPGARDHFLGAAGVALATGAGAVFGQYLASQGIGRRKESRMRRLQARRGDGYRVDPHEGAAEWLSAPTFRRPLLADSLTPDED